jgi:tetratricopeptide (TPR) repeat protein
VNPVPLLVAALFVLTACTKRDPPPVHAPGGLARGAEARSLLGEPLYAATLSPERNAKLEQDLEEARAIQPADSAERSIWVGRRLAYLGRFREAVAEFTEGIRRHPKDPRLYRHRGHRHITLREIPLAIADLERAATLIAGTPDEVEPDGQPNARGTPIGTLHSNVWYHLGLAYYLTPDYGNALRAWRECMKTADNPDRLCSTSYWVYLTLRRMGRDEEAKAVLEPIRADLDVIENNSYHALLLVFRGERSAEATLESARKQSDAAAFPTIAYGIASWWSLGGDRTRAFALYREIIGRGNWPAFGHVAAEQGLVMAR